MPQRTFPVAITLLLALVLALPSSTASATSVRGESVASTLSRADGRADGRGDTDDRRPRRFAVRPGAITTSPLDDTARAIHVRIYNAITYAPRGSFIRIASWNFDTDSFVGALTRAHKRGVTVRIIMSRQLANAQAPRAAYPTMRRNLAGYGNARRPAGRRSWIRTCSNSCRGRGGSMHSKFYMFSRSGESRRVVIQSSANLTGAAKKVQFNDAYVSVGRRITWDGYVNVWREMVADRKAEYAQFFDKKIISFFYPLAGRKNNVLDMLRRTRCANAGVVGTRGRTKVLVAQDVFNGRRGLDIARAIKDKQRRGCEVKVIYSQAVGETRPVIESMPHNHLVQDYDGDGAYDRYLHSKAMIIRGNYDGQRNRNITLNGSANFSGTAALSDEQGMIIDNLGTAKKYERWFRKMWEIRLQSVPYSRRADIAARLALPGGVENLDEPLDPYRNMES